jgi:hypothetical protein
MKRIIFSQIVILFVLSFSPGLSSAQAQNLESSFFLRPPAEVSRDLFQKLFTLNPKEEDYYLQVGLAYLEN